MWLVESFLIFFTCWFSHRLWGIFHWIFYDSQIEWSFFKSKLWWNYWKFKQMVFNFTPSLNKCFKFFMNRYWFVLDGFLYGNHLGNILQFPGNTRCYNWAESLKNILQKWPPIYDYKIKNSCVIPREPDFELWSSYFLSQKSLKVADKANIFVISYKCINLFDCFHCLFSIF